MTTGQDLVNTARNYMGQPYSTNPGRDDPNSGHKDCSGLIAAAYLQATGSPLTANVSVTIFDLAARMGLVVPFDYARNIPGACILRPENPYLGWGPAGHIGFSQGNGRTIEATPPQVQDLDIGYNAPWSSQACLLPGVDYGQGATPGVPRPDDGVANQGDTGPVVERVQIRCMQIGCDPGPVDGEFGPSTAQGVRCVQEKLGVTADGEWGPQTEKAWNDMIAYVTSLGGGVQPGPQPPDQSLPYPAWPGQYLRDRTVGLGTSTWQAQMRARGWTIDVDDVYGPASAAVALSFQQEKGLEADGVVGPATWDAAWTAPVT